MMFSENLKKYRKEAGLTFETLANKVSEDIGTKYNKSTARTWENGASPKIEIIESISRVLKLPVQYLFNNSDDIINQIISKQMPTFKSMMEHTKKVTLLQGYAGAGSSGIIDRLEVADYLYIDNSVIKKRYRNDDIKGLTIVGDSMSPYLNCCDIVLFASLKDNSYNLIDGKYIITTISGTMLKNLTFRTNGDIIISSENKSYKDEIIRADESQEYLDIIGIVVGRILMS